MVHACKRILLDRLALLMGCAFTVPLQRLPALQYLKPTCLMHSFAVQAVDATRNYEIARDRPDFQMHVNAMF